MWKLEILSDLKKNELKWIFNANSANVDMLNLTLGSHPISLFPFCCTKYCILLSLTSCHLYLLGQAAAILDGVISAQSPYSTYRSFSLWYSSSLSFRLQFAHASSSDKKITRSTRPIDAKLWKKLCLWIMFDIKIFHYQTLPYQRFKIFQIFWNVLCMIYLIYCMKQM